MASTQNMIEQCRKDIEHFRLEIARLRTRPENSPLAEVSQQKGVQSSSLRISVRKVYKGHFGKIYALQWSPDSQQFVSASQDGKLLVWHARTMHKVNAITLRSSWVMTCAYSPSGNFVACGGLDNVCSIYRLSDTVGPAQNSSGQHKTFCELSHHEGYLSGCRFIRDDEVITSSGDSTCILWDVNQKQPKAVFSDHQGDVMSIAVCEEKGYFVSGSVDSTAKLWDWRMKRACIRTFAGHDSDINSVTFFPDGNAFATGSDDAACALFDIRAYGEINRYQDEKVLTGVTCVSFSRSGRYLFAGYDDATCRPWDSLTGRCISDVELNHDNRVSCVGVSPDGSALVTGSWDTFLKLWA